MNLIMKSHVFSHCNDSHFFYFSNKPPSHLLDVVHLYWDFFSTANIGIWSNRFSFPKTFLLLSIHLFHIGKAFFWEFLVNKFILRISMSSFQQPNQQNFCELRPTSPPSDLTTAHASCKTDIIHTEGSNHDHGYAIVSSVIMLLGHLKDTS